MLNILQLFFLPPILSLFIYTINICTKNIKKVKKDILCWNISFLLVIAYLIPMDDMIYVYKNFIYYKDIPLTNFLELKLPIFFHILYLFHRLGFSFHFIYLMLIFIILIVWSYILNNIKIYNKRKIVFLVGMLFYFRVFLDITRYTMANVFFLLFTVIYLNVLNDKKNIFIKAILVGIILLLHNSLVLPIIILFLSTILAKIKIDKKVLLFFSIFIIFLRMFLAKILLMLKSILNYISYDLVKKIDHYIYYNAYSDIFIDNVVKVKMMLIVMMLLISILVVLKKKKINVKELKILENMLLLLFLFFILICDNFVLLERYSYTYFSVFIIYLGIYFKKNKFNNLIILFIVFLSLNYIFNNIYYIKKYYIDKNVRTLKTNYNGNEALKNIFYPGIYILFKDNFDDNWFDKNKNI